MYYNGYVTSLLFSLHILSISSYKSILTFANYEWDILIFTQRWPITACSIWLEDNKNNTCAFPNPRDLWTIHGIWPTKFGTKGPLNCNNTWNFNETIIEPIKAELEEYWTNVEKNTKLDSLWKHEWKKHGTCAAVLPQLNNELKYFNQGLEWIKEYNMKNVLLQKGIIPNKEGYQIQQISDAIKAVLNKNPMIQCVVDHYTKQSLISEIRICFDKNLTLVDCDPAKNIIRGIIKGASVLTNCALKKPVIYPNETVPIPPKKTMSLTGSQSHLDSLFRTREHLITSYKTLKLLIWGTI